MTSSQEAPTDVISVDRTLTGWLARGAVAAVFAVNVQSALAFIITPARYADGFEVSGVPGEMLVCSLGILFLMWNATYPPVIAFPWRFRALFAVVLAQQVIGLVGETWMLVSLPAGHEALAATATRFIAFDGAGLVLMAVAFALLLRRGARPGVSEVGQ
jgi:hypothetical protein